MGTQDFTDQSVVSMQRQKKDELVALREAALLRLENRGFDVRGKSPRQIRELMRRRRTNIKSTGSPPE